MFDTGQAHDRKLGEAGSTGSGSVVSLGLRADLKRLSPRELRTELRRAEHDIGRLRAYQTRILRQLRRCGAEVSRVELAGDLDISGATAAALQETSFRTPEMSESMAKLESGVWSFDRAAVMATMVSARADEKFMHAAEQTDIAGVRKLRAMVRRVSRRDEYRAHEERHVRSCPSLDGAVGFIHAQLPGYGWRVVTKALDERAEQLPRDSKVTTMEQQRADALVAMAQDWLDNTAPRGRSAGPIVSVVVNPRLAAPTNGEAGVTIVGGPRIGPETLEQILCEGSAEILFDPQSGAPVTASPAGHGISPKQRRYILARDCGCTIDGCDSRYRLEAHHIIPKSEGGDDGDANLTTLCWWHHQHAVHGMGMCIDPTSPARRRKLIPSKDPP